MTNTQQHPLERISGMTKTFTLPNSGVEVVIRKLDMEVITQDMAISTMRSEDLMRVAGLYAKEVNDEIGTSEMLKSVINQAEVLKAIRSGLLKEGLIRPSLDTLRTEVYGGRADSSDLGMGPDYSVLVKAIEEFNAVPTEEAGDGEAKAAAFPETVRELSAQHG